MPTKRFILLLLFLSTLPGTAIWGAEPGASASAWPNSETDSVLRLSPGRGWSQSDITVRYPISADVQTFYTTNGSIPAPGNGALWVGSLKVARTTVVRLARYREGVRLNPVETQTYFVAADVLRQTGTGFPIHWGFTNGQPVAADYEMDPEILARAGREQLEAALRSLPSVSIVMDVNDLFGAERGLYSHPLESGLSWERTASFEWIDPAGGSYQMDCGLRIQGGWNRRPEESPKHAFRLVFHKRYGAALCTFPLFSEPGAAGSDSLILRAGCNNSWLHWDGAERRRGEYLRDQWMRDTVRAMGHLSARGRFVHLYLNGLYWGLYNLAERPGPTFLAARFGGKSKQYDSRNGNNILEGDDAAWQQLMQLADAGLRGDTEYRQVERWLDVPQFIDYILANLYGSNADWDGSSNWYAGRRRKPPGPFQFYVWDAERTLEDVEASILEQHSEGSPMRLFQRLRENASFRRQFAERARGHLGEGGVLSLEKAADRFRRLADQVQLAILAESACWGDYRRDVHRYKTGPYEIYTQEDHWQPEVDRLLQAYFPRRTEVLIRQLRAAELYGD